VTIYDSGIKTINMSAMLYDNYKGGVMAASA